MLNNAGARIFEMPIYGVSETAFSRKWNEKADGFAQTSYTLNRCEDVDTEKNRLRGIIMRSEKRQYMYNQIVGFLVISIDGTDANFSLYLSDVQYRYSAKKSQKSVRQMVRSGDHLYIGNLKSNSALAMLIKERINYEVEYLKRVHKGYFLDTTVFDEVIDHIDLLSIINKEVAPNE